MLGFLFPHQCFHTIPEHWTQVHFVRHDIGYGGRSTTVANFHVARKIFLRAAELAWIDHIKATRKDVVIKVVARGATWGSKAPCEVIDPVDHMLEAEIRRKCPKATMLPTPAFLLSKEDAIKLLGTKEHLSHQGFYGEMRKRTGILMTKSGKPEGGQLRFDTENRLKIGKGVSLPDWEKEIKTRQSKYVLEAAKQIEKEGGGLGEWTGDLVFPTTHAGAEAALQRFLKTRLASFGPYQDAITAGDKVANDFHFHSVLSAPINAGLLTPADVLEATVKYAETHKVPLASLEGFVAQILGWREYMRAVYLRFPTPPPNRLKHGRKLGEAWYSGSTGLVPVDTAIQRVNKNAYLHHIERLMIVGNAMFLCKVKPDEVYRWFMEMFADSWDWVMIGNVYYMSQWTGDAITTKPYISSSAYVLRMSDYPKGDWVHDWDALYWSTVDRLAPLLRKNYRMAAQVAFWERKSAAEKKEVEKRSATVLGRL
jgi:deoxyribodipyrimidine photolyase-related protein